MAIYLQVLWQRKTLILLTTLAVVGVVAIAMYLADPVYTASTRLRVIPFGIDTPDYGTYLYFEQLSNTFMTILESDTTTNEVKQQLGADSLPDIEIREIPGTELLEIAVTSEDPVKALFVSNTLATLLIENVQSQYLASLANIESTIGSRIEAANDEISELVQELITLEEKIPRNIAGIAALNREISALEETRSQLVESYNRALVAQATQANAISIVDPATLPLEPTGPNHLIALGIAGALGLVGGAGFALTLENLNPRIYSEKQLEKVSGFRVIGRVPVEAHFSQNGAAATPSEDVERFRRLRARIMQRTNGDRNRALLVLSPDESVNAATVTANLALSLAHMYEKVLVVDTNIHRPTLDHLWDLPNPIGLSDILFHHAKSADAFQAGPVPNLAVITAGTSVDKTNESLSSEAVTEFLEEMERCFDIVVLHGPPLLPFADAIVLSQEAAKILLVMRSQSSQKMVETTRRELIDDAHKVLGIVVVD